MSASHYALAAVLAAAGVAVIAVNDGESLRVWWMGEREEHLAGAVGVNRWSPEGIELADGRVITLAGVRELPARSRALAEGLRAGVELTDDGRAVGLVRIVHWCGEDPLRRELARVDLGKLVLYIHGDGAGGEPGWRAKGDPEPLQRFTGRGFVQHRSQWRFRIPSP